MRGRAATAAVRILIRPARMHRQKCCVFSSRYRRAKRLCADRKTHAENIAQKFLSAHAQRIFSAMGEIRHFMFGDEIDHARP